MGFNYIKSDDPSEGMVGVARAAPAVLSRQTDWIAALCRYSQGMVQPRAGRRGRPAQPVDQTVDCNGFILLVLESIRREWTHGAAARIRSGP